MWGRNIILTVWTSWVKCRPAVMMVRWPLLIPGRLQHVGTLALATMCPPCVHRDSHHHQPPNIHILVSEKLLQQAELPKNLPSVQEVWWEFVDIFESLGGQWEEQSGQSVVGAGLAGTDQWGGRGGGEEGTCLTPSLSLSPLLQHHLTQFYPGIKSGQTWVTNRQDCLHH